MLSSSALSVSARRACSLGIVSPRSAESVSLHESHIVFTSPLVRTTQSRYGRSLHAKPQNGLRRILRDSSNAAMKAAFTPRFASRSASWSRALDSQSSSATRVLASTYFCFASLTRSSSRSSRATIASSSVSR